MPFKRPNSPSSAESSPRVRRRNTQNTQDTHPLATPATPPSAWPDPSPPALSHAAGSRGTPPPGTEAWRTPAPPPSRFPRDDWRGASWAPPNLATDHVTPEVFELAGKFASVAVQQALDGDAPWSDVGTNGIYLALVDLMLQCRDHMRSETGKRTVLHYSEKQPNRGYLTYDDWLHACEDEMARIYTLAQTVVPAAAFRDITAARAKQYCTAAILSTFELGADALTRPQASDVPIVPAAFLGRYDATAEQLERYGMCLVRGSISLDTDEGQILRSVAAALKRSGSSGAERKRTQGARGLQGMPLPNPVHVPVGPIAGTTLCVMPLPTRHR